MYSRSTVRNSIELYAGIGATKIMIDYAESPSTVHTTPFPSYAGRA